MGAEVARSVTQSHRVHGRLRGLLQDNWTGTSEQPGIDPYLVARLSGHTDERLLFLFYGSGGAFSAEWDMRGNPSSIAVLRTGLARAAVASEARYAVMAHNHPSGAPEPSLRDIASTRQVYRLLAALGVTLTDHVIVARDGLAFSFRLAGLA